MNRETKTRQRPRFLILSIFQRKWYNKRQEFNKILFQEIILKFNNHLLLRAIKIILGYLEINLNFFKVFISLPFLNRIKK